MSIRPYNKRMNSDAKKLPPFRAGYSQRYMAGVRAENGGPIVARKTMIKAHDLDK